MKSIAVKHQLILCRASFWLAVATILFSSLSIRAGEKIVLGTESSKINPDKKSQLSKDTAKVWGKMENEGLEDAMTIQRPQRNEILDPRKEKERKLKRLEEMNWMFVDPGELTQENDDRMDGVDQDPSKVLDKDDEKELMFKGFDKKSDSFGSKSFGQNGKKDKNPQSRTFSSSSDDEESSGRGHSLFSSQSEPKSLHSDDALSFKKLFDPSSGSSTPTVDRGDNGMGSLFRPVNDLGLTASQKATREEYKKFISGSQGLSSGAGFGGASDIPKASSGLQNPLMPKPMDPVLRAPGLDSYGPGGVSRSAAAMDPQGSMNFGGVSGYGTLQPANLNPRTTMQPSKGFEPSRARGMGSLGGHGL